MADSERRSDGDERSHGSDGPSKAPSAATSGPSGAARGRIRERRRHARAHRLDGERDTRQSHSRGHGYDLNRRRRRELDIAELGLVDRLAVEHQHRAGRHAVNPSHDVEPWQLSFASEPWAATPT